MSLTAYSLTSGVPMAPPDLSPAHRGVLAAVVLAAHALAAVVVLRSSVVPEAPPAAPAAISVSLITQDAPLPALAPTPAEQPIDTRPHTEAVPPRTAPPVPAQAAPLLASAKPVQSNEILVPVPAVEAKPAPAPVAALPAATAAPAAQAASALPNLESARPPAQPKLLPSSAVRYLIEPVLNYPRVSRDLGESGAVRLKVLVDEQGRPKDIEIARSSGFPRLDQEALRAMRAARFQPHVEDGAARAVWVPAQLIFNLDE